jgi:hypothetical protein
MGRFLLVLSMLVLPALPAWAVDKEVITEAVEQGVKALRDMQQHDGTWQHARMGATSLAGLTLLECGVDRDDKAVKAAAEKVRSASLTMTDTYSLSLSVLFLDRLDLPQDTPLIESMLVRLLAGQTPKGSYSYECPPITIAEQRRLKTESDPSRVLSSDSRDLAKLPAKGKRKSSDLPKEIQAQLEVVA